MSETKFNASRFMKLMTWGAAIMLFVMISNLADHDTTIDLTAPGITALGFIAPAMLLVALLIASHLRSNVYLTVVSCISLLTTMQYGSMLPPEQMYPLATIGLIAFMRVLYPIFIQHRDEYPLATVHDIHEPTSTEGRPRRRAGN